MSVLNSLFVGPLKKHKGIQALTVARAMLALGNNKAPGVTIFSNEKLFEIAKKTTA